MWLYREIRGRPLIPFLLIWLRAGSMLWYLMSFTGILYFIFYILDSIKPQMTTKYLQSFFFNLKKCYYKMLKFGLTQTQYGISKIKVSFTFKIEWWWDVNVMSLFSWTWTDGFGDEKYLYIWTHRMSQNEIWIGFSFLFYHSQPD